LKQEPREVASTQENVIMYKKASLQGWPATATANKRNLAKHEKLGHLFNDINIG